ncbi:MAG: hypothetical protein K6G11_04310 [Lachnospiraceae bacterium]|nr:hypothetical protein [Lachnospiraceae bacterium]
MRKNIFGKLFALSACCVLSASLLAGCGGSDSSSSKKETTSEKTTSSEATSAEDTSSEATSAEDTSSEATSAEDTSSEATSEEASGDFDVRDLEPYCSYSYMGVSNEYENFFYYLTFDENSENAMFCLLDNKAEEYAIYVGETTYEEDEDGNAFLTITNDDGSAFRLAYAYDEEKDVYYLDLGEDIGTGTVAECEASEVLDSIGKIVENGTQITLA